MITKDRNPTLDLLRGIAALCMILGHSLIVYPIDISAVPWCALLKYVIYTFHMELFFLLAGWVYRCDSYSSFIKKKVLRLLVPYFIFGTFSLFVHAFGGSLVNGNTSIAEGLSKLFFHGGSYWFLYTLFLISAVYPLISTIFKSWQAKCALLIVVLILNNMIDWTNMFTLTTIMNYLPYYIAGDLIGKSKWLKTLDSPEKGIVTLFAGSTIYTSLHFFQAAGYIQLRHILTFASAMAFCSVLYVLCTFVPVKLPDKIQRVFVSSLNDASKYSLQLYLFNGYCLTAIRILICSILHIESPLIIVLGIWLGNIAVTMFICKVILPRSRILRFLCGL